MGASRDLNHRRQKLFIEGELCSGLGEWVSAFWNQEFIQHKMPEQGGLLENKLEFLCLDPWVTFTYNQCCLVSFCTLHLCLPTATIEVCTTVFAEEREQRPEVGKPSMHGLSHPNPVLQNKNTKGKNCCLSFPRFQTLIFDSFPPKHEVLTLGKSWINWRHKSLGDAFCFNGGFPSWFFFDGGPRMLASFIKNLFPEYKALFHALPWNSKNSWWKFPAFLQLSFGFWNLRRKIWDLFQWLISSFLFRTCLFYFSVGIGVSANSMLFRCGEKLVRLLHCLFRNVGEMLRFGFLSQYLSHFRVCAHFRHPSPSLQHRVSCLDRGKLSEWRVFARKRQTQRELLCALHAKNGQLAFTLNRCGKDPVQQENRVGVFSYVCLQKCPPVVRKSGAFSGFWPADKQTLHQQRRF